MSLGERAALIGTLAQLQPRIAVEIGTAEGGSLRRLAAYAGHVHSFDLVEPEPAIRALPNVTLHTGDSHALLPQLLEDLARDDINLDFVLVDGDHSAEGVARDMRDLLASPAVGRTLILMHDTANEEVRRGLEAVDYGAVAKVRHVHLDFVMGALLAAGPFAGQLWGGLGAVIVDDERPRAAGQPFRPVNLEDTQPLVLAGLRTRLVYEREALRASLDETRQAAADVEAERDRLRSRLQSIEGSRIWRYGQVLRAAKRRLRG